MHKKIYLLKHLCVLENAVKENPWNGVGLFVGQPSVSALERPIAISCVKTCRLGEKSYFSNYLDISSEVGVIGEFFFFFCR